jgi:voltage-gated sodium channel
VSGAIPKAEKKKRRQETDCVFAENQADAYANQTRFERCVRSPMMEYWTSAMIILNSAFLGWQQQWLSERAKDEAAAGHPQTYSDPTLFVVVTWMFTVFFTIELASRWVADGFFHFFQSRDIWWNVTDMFVVAFSIFDAALELFASEEERNGFTGQFGVVRVLRIMRVVRIAKIIRVMKFFRELRIMIYSIMRSMKSLAWVILILFGLFYVFSIAFSAACLVHLDTSEKWDLEENQELQLHFGTLDRSLLSLFMSMSGGNDWAMYYEALAPLGFYYTALFLTFMAFALFAVVNVVTGVFVDSAKQSSHVDREVVVQEELEAKKNYLRQMRAIFDEMDSDDTGCISMDEFERKLGDERVIAYFHAMKLDVSDARTLFSLLDYDATDEVDVKEFLQGCYRLQGESRRLDQVFMQYEMKKVTTVVEELRDMLLLDELQDHQPTLMAASMQLHQLPQDSLSDGTSPKYESGGTSGALQAPEVCQLSPAPSVQSEHLA